MFGSKCVANAVAFWYFDIESYGMYEVGHGNCSSLVLPSLAVRRLLRGSSRTGQWALSRRK